MTYIIIIAVIISFIIFAGFWKKAQEEIKYEDTPAHELIDETEIQKIVDNVNTIEDYKELKKLFKKAERSLMNAQNDIKEREIKYEFYQDAFYKAGDKTLYYQFYPYLDLESSIEEVKRCAEIYSLEEYKNLKDKLGEESDWVPITIEEYLEKDFEKKPNYAKVLLDYLEVYNDNSLSIKEKAEKIKEVCKNRNFKNEFFDDVKPSDIPKEVMIQELRKHKVPIPDKLFELGYETIEDIKKASESELKNIDGIGQKKLDVLLKIKKA